MVKTEFKFEMGAGVDALPERTYKKGSKYDEILEAFQKQTKRYVPIVVDGKPATYISTQFNRRINALKIKGIGVTVANGVCYLEKETPMEVKKKP